MRIVIACALCVVLGFASAKPADSGNRNVQKGDDRSAGAAGQDIAGGAADEALIGQHDGVYPGENSAEDEEALSLDRYYANLPDEYIYGHCSVQPNPSKHDLNDFIWGAIDLRQSLKGGPTEIRVNMTGFNSADKTVQHGFHVHEFGDLSDGCDSAGGHYDPFGVVHGGRDDDPRFRHFGDLGNVKEDENGHVIDLIDDYLVSLLGPFSVLGRAVVIHEKEDDLGRGQNEGSLLNGNAGGRLACCTVGLSNGARWSSKDWALQWQAVHDVMESDAAVHTTQGTTP